MSTAHRRGRPRAWLFGMGLLVVLGGVPGLVGAQTLQTVQTRFERDVNRYRWTALVDVATSAGPWQLTFTNRFRSDAFLLLNDRLSFRDEDQLTWAVQRPLGERVVATGRGQAAWYNQSRVVQQEALAGLRYAVRPYAWVEPAVGVALDQRPGAVVTVGQPAPLRLDAGPAFGLRAGYAPPVPGYRVQVEAATDWHLVTPRRSRALRLGGQAERRYEDTRLTAMVRAASVRRDAYQAVSFLNRTTGGAQPETIEATTSDTLQATVELDAPFVGQMRMSGRLDLEAGNRFVRTEQAPDDALFFETDFRRRAIDAEAALRRETGRLQARLAARIGAATERRQLANREVLPPTEAAQKGTLLQQADYDEGTVRLSGMVRYTPWPRLTLTADARATAVRHDTPEVNPDDRDEVFYTGETGVLLRLSRYLEADLKVYGSYNHTVYLRAVRSAENNVQRSVRLRPSVRWRPGPRTRIRVGSEVRATYTVDDFVLPGRRSSDQSARELGLELAAERQIAGGLTLRLDAGYDDLRLGRLLWNQFAEIPFDTLRTYTGWGRVEAALTRRLVATAGLRAFIRSDFDRATTVRYPRVDGTGEVLVGSDGRAVLTSTTGTGRIIIRQLGPTCAVTWTLPAGSALRLDGWLNVQRTRQRLYNIPPGTAADQVRRAARDGTRTIIPNITLTAQWRF